MEREAAAALREWLRGAATGGGFLLLVGGCGVGKTRLLRETIPVELAGFAIVAPEPGDGDLVIRIAADGPTQPKLAIWMENLERFLPGPFQRSGDTTVTAAALRALVDGPTPVVVLATIWPQHLMALRATDEGRPCHPAAAAVVDLQDRTEVSLYRFSAAERAAAAELAVGDPTLAAALADPDPDLTAVLAGGPVLLRRYRQATAEHSAILDAALDAWRLGVRTPLSPSTLATVAGGYLNGRYDDDSWFPATVSELVRQEHGVAPLSAVRVDGVVTGYTVAGHLVQVLHAERRSTFLPEPAWWALVANIDDPRDIGRLAVAAERRGLSDYAAVLYRRLAIDGDSAAVEALDQLAWSRVLDRVRYLADHGVEPAQQWLADLLGRQGYVDELRSRAGRTDPPYATSVAACGLADLYFERGEADELRALAPLQHAADLLARLLAARGDVEALRERTHAGDYWAPTRLADLLVRQGSVDEAVRELTEAADRGNSLAAEALAELLAERGRIDELTARARSGDYRANRRLALHLADAGRTAEVMADAEAGDEHARRLAAVLIEQGVDGIDATAWPEWYFPPMPSIAPPPPFEVMMATSDAMGLQPRADAGDPDAARPMLELLARHDLIKELRAEVDAGVEYAAERLIAVLARPRP